MLTGHYILKVVQDFTAQTVIVENMVDKQRPGSQRRVHAAKKLLLRVPAQSSVSGGERATGVMDMLHYEAKDRHSLHVGLQAKRERIRRAHINDWQCNVLTPKSG